MSYDCHVNLKGVVNIKSTDNSDVYVCNEFIEHKSMHQSQS